MQFDQLKRRDFIALISGVAGRVPTGNACGEQGEGRLAG
jgi:hypothetical protein